MNAKRDQQLEQIARELLRIETLEARGSDQQDFHEVAVWQLKRALVAAYEAGRSAVGQK